MLNVNKRRNNGQLSEKERKLKIVFVRKKSRKIETPAMEIASSQIKENSNYSVNKQLPEVRE